MMGAWVKEGNGCLEKELRMVRTKAKVGKEGRDDEDCKEGVGKL